MSSEYPPLPVSLKGENVQLLPLRAEHLSGLQEAVSDGELWKLWYTFIPTPDKMEAWIRKAREEEDTRVSLPFVVQSKEGKILGSTRYMNIEKDARRLEIGTTWYAKSVQRTSVNTECKLLLLQHAFETLNCIAVEFRTNYFNFPSRKAIERLGAKLDGILRNHRWNSNGTLRDTAVYSILQSEWPTVKNNLRFKLDS
ncbi:N-acetyltransferase [Leptospira wolffii]|uniref:N-acetyltransferase n=1 Tax=Leptospira wolffii TaxID=409998 RepID=A0A2M9ZG11_9LEPT|nr:GNAT family protein [Leptospira wolffii]PJZ67368.1 N-acetyltransferase [Leptospira wolffii]